MLTITAKAADKAKEIFKDKGLEGQAALRVFVAGGGCSGYQYGMALAKQPDEEDFVIEHDGVRLGGGPGTATRRTPGGRRRRHPRRPITTPNDGGPGANRIGFFSCSGGLQSARASGRLK